MAPIVAAEDRLTSGHRLSHPPPGDEILISGISGYFPDSDSVVHLRENLFDKVCKNNGARIDRSTYPSPPKRRPVNFQLKGVNLISPNFWGISVPVTDNLKL